MTALVDFVTARLDEWAAVVDAVIADLSGLSCDHWQWELHEGPGQCSTNWLSTGFDHNHGIDSYRAFVGGFSPERARADVESKRLIVQRCDRIITAFADPDHGAWPDVNRRERSHAFTTLLLLAGVYNDHTDYNPGWALD